MNNIFLILIKNYIYQTFNLGTSVSLLDQSLEEKFKDTLETRIKDLNENVLTILKDILRKNEFSDCDVKDIYINKFKIEMILRITDMETSAIRKITKENLNKSIKKEQGEFKKWLTKKSYLYELIDFINKEIIFLKIKKLI